MKVNRAQDLGRILRSLPATEIAKKVVEYRAEKNRKGGKQSSRRKFCNQNPKIVRFDEMLSPKVNLIHMFDNTNPSIATLQRKEKGEKKSEKERNGRDYGLFTGRSAYRSRIYQRYPQIRFTFDIVPATFSKFR
jgi:hypothetical protein